MVTESELLDYVGTLRQVSLNFRFPGSFSLPGFILGLSSKLVLIHQVPELREDGYAVFWLCDVSSFRSNRFDRKFDQILRDEGVLERIGIPYDLPLVNIQALLRGLQLRNRNIIIDCENCPHADESGYHMGRIVALDDEHFTLEEFDATGEWYDVPFEIPYSSVTRVEFDTHYVNTFSKYVNPKP
jgi:hypothetical protein